MEVKTINSKLTKLLIIISLIIILINISPISANDLDDTIYAENNEVLISNELITTLNEGDTNQKSVTPSDDLKQIIEDADDNDEIILGEGVYKIHNVTLTKNITFQGNGERCNNDLLCIIRYL